VPQPENSAQDVTLKVNVLNSRHAMHFVVVATGILNTSPKAKNDTYRSTSSFLQKMSAAGFHWFFFLDGSVSFLSLSKQGAIIVNALTFSNLSAPRDP
jgi:hypothetical protein